MAEASARTSPDLPRGRTPPIPEDEARGLFERGVALFNGVRYWHAHEAWETLWRAADEEERDFYQGLIRSPPGCSTSSGATPAARATSCAEGLEKLRPYEPVHRGIVINELVGRGEPILDDLNAGLLPYLIPPVIRYVEMDRGAGTSTR